MARSVLKTIETPSRDDAADEARTTRGLRSEGRPEGEIAAPARARTADAGSKSADATDGAAKGAAGSGRKRLVLSIVGLLVVLAVIGFGVRWWLVGRFMVSTDDAYVGADIAQLSARIQGRVDEVLVKANQRVSKGDVLLRIEQIDYQLAVDQAKARLATQNATVSRIGRQVEAAQATVLQAKAQVDSAAAEVERAEAELKRIEPLAASRYSSVATLDTVKATRDKAIAGQMAAAAGLRSAEVNVTVLEAQKVEAQKAADELAVAVSKTERDLDSTVVRAPIDGIVGNKSVQVGDYLTVGKRLAALVPMAGVYIDANFKETQLADIRPGATVHIKLDAADSREIVGTVVSLAPATGAQFSLLPPENATGNFTKIVQRVPVRIAVPAELVESGVLRPGLSVEATVDIRTGRREATAHGALVPQGKSVVTDSKSQRGEEVVR